MTGVETVQVQIPWSPWTSYSDKPTRMETVHQLAGLVTRRDDAYEVMKDVAELVMVTHLGVEYRRLVMVREDQRDFNLPRFRYVVSLGRASAAWAGQQLIMTVRHRDAQRVGRVSVVRYDTWEKNFTGPREWVFLPTSLLPEEARSDA